ncbi:MAG: hypothetical protein J1E39_03250 [Eubacterium sp.]|nr:hypothetical protein [Eubacterium sp.]
MTELEKMQRAKMYIDKLANGINPIDDTPASDTDIINNVRLSRCLFYVSDILRQVIENNGVIAKSKTTKQPFSLPAEKITQFSFSPTPIPVSEIAKRINDLADLETCYKLKYSEITSWLIEIGALEEKVMPDGAKKKRPTVQGEELGILTEQRVGYNGNYTVVLYNREAQQFILDNIEVIVNYSDSKKKAAVENKGQAWTPEEEECLVDLFNKNVPVSEIAATLKRSRGGIRARLKKLGFIDSSGDVE